MRHVAQILTLGALLFGGLLASSTQAAGPATSLTISPASVHLTSDQNQTFVVTAKDKDGNTTDVTSAAFISSNDPLGSMTGATYFAGQTGAWKVQASFESLTADATVMVTAGALKELSINPNTDPELINQGSARKFTARGFDAQSNEVTGFTPTWSVIGEIGTIAADGTFTATNVGTGKVQATVGSITGQVAVVVKEVPVGETANTNGATDTNSSNTSASSNSNGNTNANDNTNAVTNLNTSNTNAANSMSEESTEACTTLATWLWVVIMIVFLIGVAILYALVPITKIWPAIVGLGGAIALIIVHRATGCEQLLWWDWVLALVTLGLSVLALRQLPTPPPPTQSS